MSNKSLKVLIYVLGSIIITFALIAAIYCGITTNDFIYGASIFIKCIGVVAITFAVAQMLMLPYYITKIADCFEELDNKLDSIITMIHYLENHLR